MHDIVIRCRRPFLAVLIALAVVGCGERLPERIEVQVPPIRDLSSDLTIVEPEPFAGGVVLKLNPKASTELSNSLTGRIEVSSVPGQPPLQQSAIGTTKISMGYTVRIVRADASSVTLSFESTPLKFEGVAKGEWEQLGGQKGEVRFDRSGALLEDPSSLFEGLFGAGMIVFPESPIGPGSTWSSENTRDMPPFGPVRIQEKFKYIGVETRNGVKVHRIDSSATGSLEGMEVTATYFIREDGLPYAANVKSKAASPVPVEGSADPIWAGFTVDIAIRPKT